MKKSRSDNKVFELSSVSAARRVPVPVLVRDGKRCPSPSNIYPGPTPDYNNPMGNHATAFTSTAQSVHNSLMNAAAHSYNAVSSQYPPATYPQYPVDTGHDSYLSNNNLASAMSPTMQSQMHSSNHMAGFSTYNPPLVQQTCRWGW